MGHGKHGITEHLGWKQEQESLSTKNDGVYQILISLFDWGENVLVATNSCMTCIDNIVQY